VQDNLEYTAAASSGRKHESVPPRNEYTAKARGKPESLPYFQSWLPSDTVWICFRAGASLTELESDWYGFAMGQRKRMKVI